MKKNVKLLVALLFCGTTLFNSCETLELDLLENPINLTEADPDLLLNAVQLNFRAAMIQMNNNGARLGRIEYMNGRNYFTNFGGGTLSLAWNSLYSAMLPDITAIEEQHSSNNDLSFHLGVSKILQATVMMNLVDYLGDIVYSEANNPEEFPSPALDDDAEVYAASIALLNEGKAYLNGASSGTATDMYYGGNTEKWIKFANTMLMRADLTVGNYNAVINASNVINSTDDDLQFNYGTQEFGGL